MVPPMLRLPRVVWLGWGLGWATICAAAAAQAPATAAAITEPGRDLLRPLQMFLGGGDPAVDRSLVIVLDPTAALAAAGFADALDRALADNAAALRQTRLGLGILGEKGCMVLAPGRDFARVAQEVRTRLLRPGAQFQDVDADLRTAAAALAGAAGDRELLLVTFDNGDVENDLEQTVQALLRAKVRLTVISSEACVADSYWAARPYQDKPRGTELVGGDSAVIDLPWGWLFQVTVANEVTPAGYAPYALNRLAAASGGRVHLYAAASDTVHRCTIYDACLFCSGDHQPQDESLQEPRLRQLAPSTLSRQDALVELGRDPYFRAVVRTWRRAAQEGLLRSQPPVKLQATSATPDRQRPGRDLDLMSSLSLSRHQKRAEQAAAIARELGEQLQQELDRIGQSATLQREEAAAQFTRVMLQLTRVNLLVFAVWCRDVAPAQLERDAPTPPPPELPIVPPGERPRGIAFSNFVLCHGVQPFFAVELPGGAALRPDLDRLDALMTAFMQRYGHTPFAFALRHMGIAHFSFTYPGIAGTVPRQRPKSGADANPVTPRRPTRAGGGSSGGSSGPTTGGK